MLRPCFLLIVSILLAGLSFAQNTDTITIQYNQKKKSFGKPSQRIYKKKNDFMIKLEGVNTLSHIIKFEFQEKYFKSEMPEGLVSLIGADISGMVASDSDPLEEIILNDSTVGEKTNPYERFKELSRVLDSTKVYIEKKYDRPAYSKRIAKDAVILIKKIYGKEKDDELTFANIAVDYNQTITRFEILEKVLNGTKLNDIGASDYEDCLAEYNANQQNHLELKELESRIKLVCKYVFDVATKKNVKRAVESKSYSSTSEVVSLKISVIDRFNQEDTVASETFDFYRQGKFKVDYSVGLGVNRLVDWSYYIDKSDTANWAIGVEEQRDIDFNTFVFAHFNWRLVDYFSLGPSIGVSTSLFSAKTSFLIGGSFGFGRNNLVSLNFGCTLGTEKLISRSISTDGTPAGSTVPLDLEEIPTYDRITFEPLGYLSLTYNFNRVKTNKP